MMSAISMPHTPGATQNRIIEPLSEVVVHPPLRYRCGHMNHVRAVRPVVSGLLSAVLNEGCATSLLVPSGVEILGARPGVEEVDGEDGSGEVVNKQDEDMVDSSGRRRADRSDAVSVRGCAKLLRQSVVVPHKVLCCQVEVAEGGLSREVEL